MTPGGFWFWTAVLAVVALIAFGFLWHHFRRARIIEDTPTSKVRSAAQGFVELEGWGKPVPGGDVVAPLTGLPCLWFRYKVEEYHRDGNRSSWRTLDSGLSDQNFLLDDNTGTCVVDPDGAEITPSTKDVWTGATRRPADKPKGFAAAALAMGRRYRYTEERLVKDDFIYALGYFETIGGGRISFDYDATIRDVIAEWKRDYQQMLERFDINNDGEIDMEEWKQVRIAARQEADKHKVQHDAAPSLHMLVRPPDRRLPFIVSTRLQDDIAKRYRWVSVACIVAFLLAGSYATFMLTARFG